MKSASIALGGVFSALCLLLMFMSSVIPFASIMMPMLAGAMLMVVVIENGVKTAMLVYISVSLLSVFIVPDLDAKLLFISFFGYYCVIKPALERIPGLFSFLLKLLIFNVAVILGYMFSLKLFGLDEAYQDSELLGTYAAEILLFGGNFCFIIYDFLLTRYNAVYINWFKPTFLRR